MRMTKKEFIKKVQKSAIGKWEEGLAAKDKVDWCHMIGTNRCSYCDAFLGCRECPLNDGGCAKEYDNIEDAYERFCSGEISRDSFIRTFTRNAKKLLQRIKDVKYENIVWD